MICEQSCVRQEFQYKPTSHVIITDDDYWKVHTLLFLYHCVKLINLHLLLSADAVTKYASNTWTSSFCYLIFHYISIVTFDCLLRGLSFCLNTIKLFFGSNFLIICLQCVPVSGSLSEPNRGFCRGTRTTCPPRTYLRCCQCPLYHWDRRSL